MNKQELIDKAVHEFGGKWPAINRNNVYMSHRPENKGTTFYPFYVTDNNYEDYLYWSISEFQQRARELGYINGYRWGVEYPTNGKKPALADDVLVQMRFYNGEWHPLGSGSIGSFIHDVFSSFRITDQRYKPADTSYLENNNLAQVDDTDVVESEWYDYDNQEAIGLPPVGEKVETCNAEHLFYGVGERGEVLAHVENTAVIRMSYGLGCFVADNLRPLDYNRKAEAEKKRVVDAAYTFYNHHQGSMLEGFYALYNAGYLKTPDQTITESNAVLANRIAQLTLVNSELNQKISDLESKLWNQTNPTSLD